MHRFSRKSNPKTGSPECCWGGGEGGNGGQGVRGLHPSSVADGCGQNPAQWERTVFRMSSMKPRLLSAQPPACLLELAPAARESGMGAVLTHRSGSQCPANHGGHVTVPRILHKQHPRPETGFQHKAPHPAPGSA